MGDDREFEIVERKVTAERTARAFIMRKSRARLEASLTDAMLDAEREIEKAFRIIAGHMGYGTLDPLRVKGLPNDTWALEHMDQFIEWQENCPSRYRGVILDHLVFCFSFDQIAEQRGLTDRAVAYQYRNGLNEYCLIRGWGEQIKK